VEATLSFIRINIATIIIETTLASCEKNKFVLGETRSNRIPKESSTQSSVIISIRGEGSVSAFIALIYTPRGLRVYVAVERAIKY